MDTLETCIKKDALFHAYGIEGNRENLVQKLLSHIEGVLKVSIKRNPDVQVLQFDVMGIGEACGLENSARVKAFGEDGKFFLIAANTVTREAQNALLKLFEEPTNETYFFLVMPTCEVLLPTLRSRLLIISTEEGVVRKDRAEAFVHAALKERFEFLKEIIDTKDKVAAITFLSELETHMHSSMHRRDIRGNEVRALKAISQARSYMNDRSPSIKMLLEHVALSVPTL